jgi:tetratricopeptide (TPR) repeat protein
VTARPYVVKRLEELERFENDVAIPVRIPLGIRAFGINAYAASAKGDSVIEEHDELGSGAGGHEELYVVVRGAASFVLDDEEIDAPAGTLVFVRDRAVKRRATAREADTTVLVVGGVPGKAFEPSPWESWFEALPHYQEGDYGRAVEVLTRALQEHPGNPNVLYNLACCESLAGRTDEALAHLRRASEGDERMRTWARDDPDLAALRDDPRFPLS